MDIVIDFTSLQDFFSLPPDKMLHIFFIRFGWIILAVLFLMAVRSLWLSHVQGKWFSGIKFIFLAIDIPRGNIQSPRAVENMFSYLAGAHSTQNFFEKWFLGESQLSFSLEIISSEGYTQFLIRAPEQFRNLVESAIYSQHPDAEIIEVNDYCEGFPTKFPDEEYDVWGLEFTQGSHYMYPIKTYKDFEHQFGPDETVFRDPMAELMELCSSLRRGEHLWYQIILIPTGFDWTDDGLGEISKILGEPPKTSFLNKAIDAIVNLISDLSEMIFSLWGDVEDREKEFRKLSMMELTPKQKKKIEAIEEKSSKLGFLCKIRVVYMAKKEAMNKAKVANGFVGYIKQFAALDLNNFKPDLKRTGTKASYFNKTGKINKKKNNLVSNYISRNDWAGVTPFLLNTEELATIWHFPVEATSNAPLIQKAPTKKYKPPANLVSDDSVSTLDVRKEELLSSDFSRASNEKRAEALPPKVEVGEVNDRFSATNETNDSPRGAPPSNLPFG